MKEEQRVVIEGGPGQTFDEAMLDPRNAHKVPPKVREALKLILDSDRGNDTRLATLLARNAFRESQAFLDTVKLYAGKDAEGGAIRFMALADGDHDAAFRALVLLSQGAVFALKDLPGFVGGENANAPAPTDMEILRGGPDVLRAVAERHESRFRMLAEMVSTYFHETGHALALTACGGTAKMVVSFVPSTTENGFAVQAANYGCGNIDPDAKASDAQQATVTVAGLIFELLGPCAPLFPVLVKRLMDAPDFWVRVMANAKEVDEDTADTINPQYAITLHGIVKDAETFNKEATTDLAKREAVEQAMYCLEPHLTDSSGEGAMFVLVSEAATTHFKAIESAASRIEAAMHELADLPTFGPFGDEAVAKRMKKETKGAKQ